MVVLFVLAGVAQALDLLTFAPAVARFGALGEANPVMAAAYSAGGIWGAALAKGLFLLLALLAIHAIAGAGGPAWIGAVILVFAIVVGLLGAATNLWALSL